MRTISNNNNQTQSDSSFFLITSLNLLLINGICNAYAILWGNSFFKTFTATLLILSIFFLVKSSIPFVSDKKNKCFPHHYKMTLYFILIWGGWNILKSIKPELKTLTDIFGLPSTGMAWVVPIAMFAGAQLHFWKKLIYIFTLHTILGIILFLIFMLTNHDFFNNSPEYINWYFLYPSGFLILNWRFQERKVNIIALTGFICFTANGWLMGRRYLVLISLIYFIFLIKSYSHKSTSIYKSFISNLVLLGLIVTFLFSYTNLNTFANSTQYNTYSSYNRILYKGIHNSRTGFYNDLTNHISTEEFFLGKGVLGGYRSSIFRNYNNPFLLRKNIEIGYLQIILKCGLVMLALFLIICVPAGFYGVFFSRNSFTFTTGLIVVNRLIEMFIFGLPAATCSYVLFWLAVGSCLNPSLRNATNNYITSMLHQHNKFHIFRSKTLKW